MVVLRIEHPVPSYEGWKRAFDGDPLRRKESGVRRYRVLRAMDNPNYVMIDLEFDTREPAEAMLEALRAMWGNVEGKVMSDAKARVVEQVEDVTL